VKNIITIDGPSGSGKGTLAKRLAETLGFHLLDSGALYRVVGFIAKERGIDFDNSEALSKLAKDMPLRFEIDEVHGEVSPVFAERRLGDLIRTDEVGQAASAVAAIPAVREALLSFQREFYREPGLVADGRDMGTVVFPEAPVKIFLTASPECRAERRYKQLKSKGIGANMRALLESIKARDERDSQRSVAPLKPAADALIIDSSNMTLEEVVQQALTYVRSKLAV